MPHHSSPLDPALHAVLLPQSPATQHLLGNVAGHLAARSTRVHSTNGLDYDGHELVSERRLLMLIDESARFPDGFQDLYNGWHRTLFTQVSNAPLRHLRFAIFSLSTTGTWARRLRSVLRYYGAREVVELENGTSPVGPKIDAWIAELCRVAEAGFEPAPASTVRGIGSDDLSLMSALTSG